MRRITIILILVMQSFLYAGPVCGNHITTAESMACCEKGHGDSGDGPFIVDDHANSCCATCDMGKAQAIDRQKGKQLLLNSQDALPAFSSSIPITGISESLETDWSYQKFSSFSSPELFLLKQSFRI